MLADAKALATLVVPALKNKQKVAASILLSMIDKRLKTNTVRHVAIVMTWMITQSYRMFL